MADKGDSVRMLQDMGFTRRDSLAAIDMCKHARKGHVAGSELLKNSLQHKEREAVVAQTPPTPYEFEVQYRMLVVMRSDVTLTPSQLAAGVSEVVLNSDNKVNPTWTSMWHSTSRQRQFLKGTEQELNLLQSRAKTQCIPYHPALSETLQTICLAVGPAPASLLDPLSCGLEKMD